MPDAAPVSTRRNPPGPRGGNARRVELVRRPGRPPRAFGTVLQGGPGEKLPQVYCGDHHE